MFHLQPASIEWALKHLQRFYASDFFPKSFEFAAIADSWSDVKKHVRDLDLHTYVPQTPIRALALKPNGTFRVVHELDPIDSIIYTGSYMN